MQISKIGVISKKRLKLCICEVGNVPSGDVLVTVSTKFSRKEGKAFCTINSSFLVSTTSDNISRGYATKMEFPEGRGGGSFYEPILENPEGIRLKRKIPSVGGMDIFWISTFSSNQHFNYF